MADYLCVSTDTVPCRRATRFDLLAVEQRVKSTYTRIADKVLLVSLAPQKTSHDQFEFLLIDHT
jgi:hypothetical protein